MQAKNNTLLLIAGFAEMAVAVSLPKQFRLP
jgi:hypothetical protein